MSSTVAHPPASSAPAKRVVTALAERRATLAVAESLTGGSLTAALVAAPGASRVVRGGIVAYATELKASLLGVDADLLRHGGPVQAEVARQMVLGAMRALGASHALATTGVAGPGPSDGVSAGTVIVAAGTGDHVRVRSLRLSGTRRAVRRASGASALALLLGLIEDGE